MPPPTFGHASLKVRLALVMTVVFISFSGLLALLGLRYFAAEFRNNLYEQQFTLASELARDIDDKLRVNQEMLVAMARQVAPQILSNPQRAQAFLDQHAELFAIFDNGLLLISAQGRVVAESPRAVGQRGRDVSQLDVYRGVSATGMPYLSKPFVSVRAQGRPALSIGLPLFDQQGTMVGRLHGSFELLGRNFLADLSKVKIGKSGYIFVTTPDRVIISHADVTRIMKPAPAPGQNLLYDQAIAGFEGSGRTITSVGVPMLASYKRVGSTGWILGVNYPAVEAEVSLRQAQTYFFLAVLVGTTLVLLLVWLIMKRSLAPLDLLTRHVQELPDKKGADQLLPLRTGGEIGTLVNTFNTMVQTLEQQQRHLRENEERFRSLTEMSTDWYWEQDTAYRFILMSHGLQQTKVKTEIGKARWELPIVGVTESQWDEHRKTLERRETFKNFVYQVKTETGELRTFSISGSPIFGTNGEFRGYRGVGSDITERKLADQQIEFLAFHDALTGLPNRMLMQDRFEQAMAQAERDGSKVALVFLDLDNFKSINDTLGHDAGDALLRQVATRLRECVRDTDTISRQGGDEFLIVLRDLPDTEVASAIMLKIMERLQEPFLADSQEISTSVSMGASIFPGDGNDFETLRRQADMAMYQAKDAGRNTYRFFDEAMNVEATEHLLLRNGLRRALERSEFVLHYQPQIDLASGAVIGVEALIRWNHPELGMVAPARFIPVAEESGLIVPIGQWVLREACRQAVAWKRAGLPALTMAVNLSAVQFKRGDVEQSVMQALEQTGLNPALLELELTESILIQNVESVLATVKRLKLLGVKISIDDFGTGYSSLSYLKRFDIDKLKIDQSFVRDLATDPDDAAIVRAIIQMARSLNLRTIAEGVESAEMQQQLRIFQCDEAQGYHFARPMPAQEMERYLAEKQRGKA
jgi:diguanylate cyclase (GGDEF)-like protein/PAS domain S-box-containing protein